MKILLLLILVWSITVRHSRLVTNFFIASREVSVCTEVQTKSFTAFLVIKGVKTEVCCASTDRKLLM